MPDLIQLAIEVVSAVLCFVLVKFMLKPYEFTREGRYLGLPLGFAFLGISEVLLGIGIFIEINEIRLIALISRTFAYIFLVVTYYFSKKPRKYSHVIWNMTFSLIVVILAATSFIMLNGSIGFNQPLNPSIYFRIFSLICVGYICIHTLRSHIQNPERDTIWIPIGFILFGISQYSILIWASDAHYVYGVAFTGGWIARLAGLSIFIAVSYLTLHKRLKKP